MKTVILLLSIIMWAKISYCQKHEIDASTISNWPIIEGELISNNGEYIYYTIINKERSKSKLIINSTKGQFYREFEGEIRAFFTQDSRYVVFIKREDTLCLINLAGGNDIYIPDVSSFNLPDGGTGQWLSYITKDAELHIYDLKAGKKEEYQHVKNYQFSKSGNALLIDYTSKEDNIRKRYLKWVDLLNKRSFLIRSGYDVVAFSNYSFGYDEQELAFISQDTIRNKISNSIWYYHLGMDSARLCVSDYNKTHEEGFEVKNSEILFSQNGDKIMFKLSHVQQVKKPNKNLANVDIWNYKDEFPQDKQLKDVVYEQNRDFVVVYNLNSGKLFRLEKECDGQWGRGYINLSYNSEYFITQNIVSFSEAYRLPKERPDIYLTNTTDGLREQIAKEVFTAGAHFSPGGKYVYWYDKLKECYFTYNIKTKVKTIICPGIKVKLYDEDNEIAGPPNPYGVASWLEADNALLVYDKYDIWKLDPNGIISPINITRGFGRSHKLILRLVYFNSIGSAVNPALGKNAKLLLCALDERKKDNGFYICKSDGSKDPEKLTMTPDFYYFSSQSNYLFFSHNILKAKDTNVYLLTRQSASEFPNLQVTTNFTDFKQLTNLCPQKDVNWLSRTLEHWITFDGSPGLGILYKPENFDPKKKYPVIFYFYSILSDGLNEYINPGLSEGPINIPWFVSRGYLVFCPDIHYKVGIPGQSVYNNVVSAAKYMKTKPWVEANKMGIQGHSLGGFEVNCLVSRTGIFAAAVSAAGTSDLVSMSGLSFADQDAHAEVEQFHFRMGATLWQNRSAYINNSAVFSADKISTPLLIVQNKLDPAILWNQGLELFSDMRRAGKKVWMLQYDDNGHTMRDEDSQLDYTVRMEQFFEYYLKDGRLPKWMSDGIPAKLKGIDSGFEYSDTR